MKYVIDSSVAFKWPVAEINQDKAQRLREDYRNGVHDLLAVDIFPAEVANALVMAQRRGRIQDHAAPLFDVLTTSAARHLASTRTGHRHGFPSEGDGLRRLVRRPRGARTVRARNR